MTLFPVLDEIETKKNARRVLREYRSLYRLSGVTTSIQSPQFSDMPRGGSTANGVEYTMVKSLEHIDKAILDRYQDRRDKLYAISQALDTLSQISYAILDLSYCIADPYSVIKLANNLKVYKENINGDIEAVNYSDKNIEVLKSQALIEFAEAYHYENLLVYKN